MSQTQALLRKHVPAQFLAHEHLHTLPTKMPRQNQILVDHARHRFLCLACDNRQFRSQQGLLQHCRTSSAHEDAWCERCNWLFVSPVALTAHLESSHNHWICEFCDEDEIGEDDLVSHQETEHYWCYHCDVSFDDYDEHRVDAHHRCHECTAEFRDDNQRDIVCMSSP